MNGDQDTDDTNTDNDTRSSNTESGAGVAGRHTVLMSTSRCYTTGSAD